MERWCECCLDFDTREVYQMIFNTNEWSDIIKKTYDFYQLRYLDETGNMEVFYVNSLFNKKLTSHPFNTCLELMSTNPLNLIKEVINS